MPPIKRYACNQCDFELPSGWGGYTYAVDNQGHRVVCPHPGEFGAVSKVTGLNYTEADAAGRVGFAQYCACLGCLKQFDLDLKRDAVICPACHGYQVRSLRQLIGQSCPNCKTGLIEEGSVVHWKLDPDWEQLPVPQIVKDLTEFANRSRVPSSLQSTSHAVAERFDEPLLLFWYVALRLLDWWEGDYFSRDQDQKESAELRGKLHDTLQVVLPATPALDELVVLRDGWWWFAEDVGPDVRRGIKNYIRKNRIHVMWS